MLSSCYLGKNCNQYLLIAVVTYLAPMTYLNQLNTLASTGSSAFIIHHAVQSLPMFMEQQTAVQQMGFPRVSSIVRPRLRWSRWKISHQYLWLRITITLSLSLTSAAGERNQWWRPLKKLFLSDFSWLGIERCYQKQAGHLGHLFQPSHPTALVRKC